MRGPRPWLRSSSASLVSRLASAWRRHWLFTLFVAAGVALRAAVTVAYWPALELNGDSYSYLRQAHAFEPGIWHPFGYSLLLWALAPLGNLAAVPIAQHLLGIALAVLIYVFLLHLGVRRPLAALAALPVLLDAYQLDIEQFVLAETLVDVLLMAGLVTLLWRRRVTLWRGVVVGVLIAAATLTRTEALPVVALIGLYLLVRRWWRPLLGYTSVALALLIAYGGWYGAANGSFGYSGFTGYYLYGRVAPFAKCHDYALPAKEAVLCPHKTKYRIQSREFYAFSPHSQLNRHNLGTHRQRNALAKRFAYQVILHQPFDYLAAVTGDTWHYFTPGRWMSSDPVEMSRWRFPGPHLTPWKDQLNVYFANRGFDLRPIRSSVTPALMGPLRAYQAVVYTQGPIFLACLLAALAAGVSLIGWGTQRRRARWAALILGLSGLLLAITPSLATGFSYRYQIPLLVVLPPAGIIAVDLGLDALVRRRRRESVVHLSSHGTQPGPPVYDNVSLSDERIPAAGASKVVTGDATGERQGW